MSEAKAKRSFIKIEQELIVRKENKQLIDDYFREVKKRSDLSYRSAKCEPDRLGAGAGARFAFRCHMRKKGVSSKYKR